MHWFFNPFVNGGIMFVSVCCFIAVLSDPAWAVGGIVGLFLVSTHAYISGLIDGYDLP